MPVTDFWHIQTTVKPGRLGPSISGLIHFGLILRLVGSGLGEWVQPWIILVRFLMVM